MSTSSSLFLHLMVSLRRLEWKLKELQTNVEFVSEDYEHNEAHVHLFFSSP